jgi:DNA N-6-adenine-methyltransferase (Dam)
VNEIAEPKLVAQPDARPSFGPGGGRTRDDYGTPPALLARLSEEFGPFDTDPCPFPRPPGFDGLSVTWGRFVFVNPPYGRQVPFWLAKALAEIAAGRTETAVFLLFARTDTAWYNDLILPFAHEVRFLRGRLTFLGADGPAPYPSMIVVFRNGPRIAGAMPVLGSYLRPDEHDPADDTPSLEEVW